MAEKKTYLMRKAWNPMLRLLSKEQAGEILQAICAYQDGQEYEFEDPSASAIYAMIAAAFEEDEAAYKEKCESNKANGSKGGRPSKPKETEENQTVSEETEENRTVSEKTERFLEKPYKDKDRDKEYKEKTSPKGEAKEKGTDPLEKAPISDPLKDKVREWLQYKREKREGYKPTGYKSLITQIANAEQEHGSIAVIRQIDAAMSSGWKGIGLERMRAAPGRTREPTGAELAMQMAIEALCEPPQAPPRDISAELDRG